MELRQLRYFVEIADQGSFTRAAETLSIAQPALTTQIQKLEAEFNAQLFLRTTRGIVLTDVGREVLAQAHRALDAADATKRAAQLAGAAPNARVVIGYTRIFPILPVARTLRRLRRAHPQLNVELREMWSQQQLEAVESGALDVAFLYAGDAPIGGGLSVVPIARETLTVAVPDRHPLATRRQIALAELHGEDFIVPANAIGGETLRDRVMTACARAGVVPGSIQETSGDIRVLLGFVSAGLGIAFLTSSSRDVKVRGVHYATVTPAFAIDFVAVHRNGPSARLLEPFLERIGE